MKLGTLFALVITSLLLIPLEAVNAQTDRGVGVKKASTAKKRVALVIGNGDYQNTTKLPNPKNDATDMAAELESLGFEVFKGVDQGKREMENLIREFGNRLAETKAVGLFFYAGHGIAVKGTNYLIPVDARIEAEDEVQYFSVSMNFLLGKMDSAGNGFNMVILDACRNNPFARSWRNFRDVGDSGGLARVNAPTGTLIAYATKPGDVASDGDGRNGLYTEALLKHMRVKNVDVTKMLQNVRADVLRKSGDKQVPFDESSLVGDFYFAGNDGTNVATVSRNVEDVLWEEVSKSERISGYQSYLRDYPNGKYASTAKLKLKTFKEQNDWDSIQGSRDRADFEKFLKDYPDGSFADQAKAKYEQVWWDSVKNSASPADIEAFLADFPNGDNASAAKQILSTLSWESLGDKKDIANVRKYLADFPNGKYAPAAKAILAFEDNKDLARSLLKYRYVGVFSEGLVRVSGGYVDKSGNKVISDEYNGGAAFSEGMAAVSKEISKCCSAYLYIDKTGREITKPKYTDAKPFSGGRAWVRYVDKKSKMHVTGYIDKSGREFPDPDEGRVFSDGLARFRKGNLYGFKDRNGIEAIEAKYGFVHDFSNGFAAVRSSDNKWGVIDTTGREITPLKYSEVSAFSEGLAHVRSGNRSGFIDKTGREVIAPRYDYACSFSGGMACMKIGDKYGFIDRTGKVIFPPKFDDVYWCKAFIKEGIYGVKLNGKKGFVDAYGNEYFDF